MATLHVVATPIGNLEDMSLRALRILSEVDFILCEDTRVTKKLLEYYKIKTPLISYHQHSQLKKVEYIIQLLREGKNVALVSDAGTPGISDPGGKLIREAWKQCGNVAIVPVPGPSAITAAASISGFAMDKFLFLGFPPHKKKRKKFFEEVISSKYPVIFYESPHRIGKTLQELSEIMKQGGDETRNIAVCRELTKKFETVYRGTIHEVVKQIEPKGYRGEFVIVLAPKQ